jgi:sugar-specific transcriptional regulator TrmB
LERLKHKGAALVQRSEPTLWAPVPHRELVGRLRRDMEATCSEVEQGLVQLGYEQDTALTWSLSGRGHVVDSMRRPIGRARERLTGALPARELAELGASLAAAVERGVSVDLVTDDGATIDLPDGDGIRIRRRSDGEPDQDRLAVVVGDGTETVLADLGRDRPERRKQKPVAALHGLEVTSHDIDGGHARSCTQPSHRHREVRRD